jgi:putative MATE family efflux protein
VTEPIAPEPPPPYTRARRLSVWTLAWPSMTLFALQSLVGVVDFLFVSSLGTQAIAGVGVAVQIQFLTFGLLEAVTTGTVALIAREIGSGRPSEAARAMRTALVLAAGFGALLMLAMPASDRIVGWMGVAPEVVSLGGRCLRILLGFGIPVSVGATLAMGLRGAGDVRTPLAIGIVTNLVNVVACWTLIFGRMGAPALGAEGSVWASGIAFVTGALLFLWLWGRGDLVLPTAPWRGNVTAALARRVLRVGIPTALERGAFQLGLLLFLRIVAGFGTEPISAYLIGVRILAFCFVPGFGFANAAATLVGQNLGAGRPDEAARSGWRATAGAVGVMSSVGLAIILLARPLAGSFGAVGEETVRLTVIFIYILGAAQPLMAIEFTLGGALRGAGDTRFPLFSLLAGLLVFRLGAAEFLAKPLFGNVVAVWSCLLADYAVKGALLSWRFRSGRWKLARV